MTNEELKKKIVEILDNNIRWQPYYYISRGIVYEDDLKNIADALIAAGYGNVADWKRRAEVAERALEKFAENITCEDCPFSFDCDSSEKREDIIHSNYCFAEYLRQAEREIKEEEQ